MFFAAMLAGGVGNEFQVPRTTGSCASIPTMVRHKKALRHSSAEFRVERLPPLGWWTTFCNELGANGPNGDTLGVRKQDW